MAGHFVEPAMLIPQILICSLLFGFDCYCERKATIKPHGIQCAFLRMLTIVSERFYLSQLWTPVKPNHTEMGYGVGNDLLNVALFLGFDRFKYQGAGLKLSLELFR